MTNVQAAVLGTVQGLSEFLPISSSAHLYAIPTLLGWKYAGLAFDVILHWGTLLALLIAYGRDWLALAAGVFSADAKLRDESRTTWLKLIAASVPAAIAGVLLQKAAETGLRSIPLQATMLFVFGFLLWWVDRRSIARDDVRVPGWGACMLVGTAQALALVPGVSRSGITITAGRMCGLTRTAAARFSFLLATPITLGAGLLELRHIPHDIPAGTLLVGLVTSAVVGLLAIRALIRWLSHAGLGVFFAYRAAFALLLIVTWIRR